MKYLFLLAALSVNAAFAQRDSVAFFYRPERVSVLIQERKEAGTRLEDFIDHVSSDIIYTSTSQDQNIRIACGKGMLGSECTFTFTPGPAVVIKDRALVVNTTLENLGLPNVGPFKMSFAGSMKDKFSLEILPDGTVRMEGSKKIGTN